MLPGLPAPRVTDSARKHGITDDDLLHAFANSVRAFEEAGDVTMFIGPDRAGNLLEVGVIETTDDSLEIAIIHAMPVRKKYLDALQSPRRRR